MQPQGIRLFCPALAVSRDFTLIELLVVLAILGLLVGLVGPRVMNALGGSKTKTAGIQIAGLGSTLRDLLHRRRPLSHHGGGLAGPAGESRRCRQLERPLSGEIQGPEGPVGIRVPISLAR